MLREVTGIQKRHTRSVKRSQKVTAAVLQAPVLVPTTTPKAFSVEDKKALLEDKKVSVSSGKAKKESQTVEPKGRGRGRGRGGPKLLDTSNVKHHIDPVLHQQSLDEGDMKDRKQTAKVSTRKKR